MHLLLDVIYFWTIFICCYGKTREKRQATQLRIIGKRRRDRSYWCWLDWLKLAWRGWFERGRLSWRSWKRITLAYCWKHSCSGKTSRRRFEVNIERSVLSQKEVDRPERANERCHIVDKGKIRTVEATNLQQNITSSFRQKAWVKSLQSPVRQADNKSKRSNSSKDWKFLGNCAR